MTLSVALRYLRSQHVSTFGLAMHRQRQTGGMLTPEAGRRRLREGCRGRRQRIRTVFQPSVPSCGMVSMGGEGV